MKAPYSNNPQDILSSWIALEVLSPQTFRKRSDLVNGSNSRIVSLDDGVLPWEVPGVPRRKGYSMFYHVIIGTVDFERAISALLEVYADKRPERPQTKGEAVLGCITLDAAGRPASDTCIALSSFAWGVRQALKKDLVSLAGWPEAEKKMIQALEKLLFVQEEDGGFKPLDVGMLDKVSKYLAGELKLPDGLLTRHRFAIRVEEYGAQADAPEPVLMNSFFLGDLTLAVKLFGEKSAPASLKRFLGVLPPSGKTDLLQDLSGLEAAVSPGMIPPARWPGPGRYPLVLLQQAAVNLALNSLGKDGILAVNGPPGTGKTTLLRDVVVGLVVGRAEAMCQFDNPADAFEDSREYISTGTFQLKLFSLDARLKGYEMLIASSNNKAVENVSQELPGLQAIAGDADDLRYFTCLSDALLEKNSWGLIAAVLGNAANRGRFRQTFWWDKEVGLATYLAEAMGNPQYITNDGDLRTKPLIIEKNDAPAGGVEALSRWKDARKRFLAALDGSRKELEALGKVRRSVLAFPSMTQKLESAKNNLRHIKRQEKECRTTWTELDAGFTEAEEQLAAAKSQLQELQRIRPGFFARLFRTKVARLWKSMQEKYWNDMVDAKHICDELAGQLKAAGRLLANAEAEVAESERRLIKARKTWESAKGKIDRCRSQLKDHFMDDVAFSSQHASLHQRSPWCDQAMQRTRDNVFISAMQLHKAFVDAAARPLKHNLGVLMNIFSRRGLMDDGKMALLADIWASLFLVVPAISTTFASVDRMLGQLPPESLGWLLVDEAGQALPQAAVGAMARTRRAVVVGDPMQIEPVVVLPELLTKSICERFHVSPERFCAPEASVQTLADAASQFCTTFEGRSGSRMVGVPLLVHRRCEDPMFGISNTIAYEHLMVKAKGPGASVVKNCLGESHWIEVEGESEDKWCMQEGLALLERLRKLRNAGIPPDIYIITPFVIVANGLRQLLLRDGILNGWVNKPDLWVRERVGTVHTVQGREAEAVFLVLGAQGAKLGGARNWAGAKPNLLNVAVTRAKEVFYVIGNRKMWRNAGVFGELAGRLKVVQDNDLET